MHYEWVGTFSSSNSFNIRPVVFDNVKVEMSDSTDRVRYFSFYGHKLTI